jgi:hypothetical protein
MQGIRMVTAVIAIGVVSLSSAQQSSAASAYCYKYEPASVTLKGTLSVRTEPGPPGYGENPETDSKEDILVLTLFAPICVDGDPTSETNSGSEFGIRELQSAGPENLNPRLLDRYIGKTIVATGTLHHAENAHHRTNVLFSMDSVEQAPAQSASVDAGFAAARRAAPKSISDDAIHAALRSGLVKPDGTATAITIAREEGSFILVLIRGPDGTYLAADSSLVEDGNFGKLGRPRGDYERYETVPTKWLPRTDGLLQVIMRTRAWRARQRYTVSEPLVIKPDGTVLFR